MKKKTLFMLTLLMSVTGLIGCTSMPIVPEDPFDPSFLGELDLIADKEVMFVFSDVNANQKNINGYVGSFYGYGNVMETDPDKNSKFVEAYEEKFTYDFFKKSHEFKREFLNYGLDSFGNVIYSFEGNESITEWYQDSKVLPDFMDIISEEVFYENGKQKSTYYDSIVLGEKTTAELGWTQYTNYKIDKAISRYTDDTLSFGKRGDIIYAYYIHSEPYTQSSPYFNDVNHSIRTTVETKTVVTFKCDEKMGWIYNTFYSASREIYHTDFYGETLPNPFVATFIEETLSLNYGELVENPRTLTYKQDSSFPHLYLVEFDVSGNPNKSSFLNSTINFDEKNENTITYYTTVVLSKNDIFGIGYSENFESHPTTPNKWGYKDITNKMNSVIIEEFETPQGIFIKANKSGLYLIEIKMNTETTTLDKFEVTYVGGMFN